jgi:hypothetical protein
MSPIRTLAEVEILAMLPSGLYQAMPSESWPM